MKKIVFGVAIAFTMLVCRAAQQNEYAKWDKNMAIAGIASTNGFTWIDGRNLPIEGRAFDNVEAWYDRIPDTVTTNVNGGVRAKRHTTSGMQFRFVTDSKRLAFKWIPYSGSLSMDHMPSTGVSGIDVYRFDKGLGKWRYVATGRIKRASGGDLEIPWKPGEPCLVNLPLYNGLKSFELGVLDGSKVTAMPPRKNGVVKPVVFYGTSITQGGCASRPGMSFVNIVGRELDVPVVNFGFSGSGVMEVEMSEHLASIDASCYVLDCLWNMGMSRAKDVKSRRGRDVDLNYEPFIRNLRAKRPDVPIVMAERCDVFCREPNSQDRYIRRLYEKLVAEGWKNLVYLPKERLYCDDFEGTVDGVHPNDYGMAAMAKGFGAAVKTALGL